MVAGLQLRSPRPRTKLVALAVASCFAGVAHANPVGPTVMHGTASFNAVGNAFNITNSPNAILNWQGFSIGTSEITRFIQNSAASSVLNRVTGPESSSILGQLLSNGRVMLINPNGVFIGGGAVIDVAGFTASSLKISDADFLAGKFKFTDQVGAARIVNQGVIRTPEGGQVYLIAPSVENSGLITSPTGEVVLAAGKTVELIQQGTPYVRVELTAPDNAAVNVGQVIARGGNIGIYGSMIKNAGVVSASTASVGENGKIVLRAKQDVTLDAGSRVEASGTKGGSVTVQAEGGTLISSGAVEVKGSAGRGGDVSLLGDKVGIGSAAQVDASGDRGGGVIRVGGDYQGNNPEIQNSSQTVIASGATLNASSGTEGNGGRVIVWSDGDTRSSGAIAARGGALSGDGGFVEVSGARNLNFSGQADTSAANGSAGTLLLDPTDLYIVNGAMGDQDSTLASNGGSLSFSGADTPDNTVSVNQLRTLGDTNITLQAKRALTVGASGGAAATVDLSSSLKTPANTLTLQAGDTSTTSPGAGDVVFNSGSSITTGGGSVRIVAGDSTRRTGNAVLGSIATPGGQITVIAQQAVSVNGSASLSTAGMSGTMATAGGNVMISAGGALTVGAIDASGGSSTAAGMAGANGGNVVLRSSGPVTTGVITTSGGAAGNMSVQTSGGASTTTSATTDTSGSTTTSGASTTSGTTTSSGNGTTTTISGTGATTGTTSTSGSTTTSGTSTSSGSTATGSTTTTSGTSTTTGTTATSGSTTTPGASTTSGTTTSSGAGTTTTTSGTGATTGTTSTSGSTATSGTSTTTTTSGTSATTGTTATSDPTTTSGTSTTSSGTTATGSTTATTTTSGASTTTGTTATSDPTTTTSGTSTTASGTTATGSTTATSGTSTTTGTTSTSGSTAASGTSTTGGTTASSGTSTTTTTSGTSTTTGTTATSDATTTSGTSTTSSGTTATGSTTATSGTSTTTGTTSTSGLTVASGTSATGGTTASSGTATTTTTSGTSTTTGTTATSDATTTSGTSTTSGTTPSSGTATTTTTSGTSTTAGTTDTSGSTTLSGTSATSGTTPSSGISTTTTTPSTSASTGTTPTSSGANGGAAGNITIQSGTGAVTLGGAITALGGEASSSGGTVGSAGTVSLGTGSGSSAVGAISGAGAAIKAGTLTVSSGGAVDLTNSGNNIGTLGTVTTAGKFDFKTANTVTVAGTVSTSDVTAPASGAISIQTTAGDVVVNGTVATGKADASSSSATGAASGGVTIKAAGAVTGTGEIKTGNAAASGATAQVGTIDVQGAAIGSSTAPQNVTLGTSTASGGGTATTGAVNIATTGASGASGSAYITSSAPLNVKDIALPTADTLASAISPIISIATTGVRSTVSFDAAASYTNLKGSGTAADGARLIVDTTGSGATGGAVTFNKALETGSITVKVSGSVAVNAPLSTSAVDTSAATGVSAKSGDITIAAAGNITGTGTLTTGAAKAQGGAAATPTIAQSGAVTVQASGGAVQVGTIATGNAELATASFSTDKAVSGGVALSGASIGSGPSAQTVVIGSTLTAGAGARTSGTLAASATADGASGGGVWISSPQSLTTDVISTVGSGAPINVASSGAVDLSKSVASSGGDINISGSAVSLTLGEAIRSTAAANSGLGSGGITIGAFGPGGGGVTLNGSVISRGAVNADGTTSDAGAVVVTAADGDIQLGNVNATGGKGGEITAQATHGTLLVSGTVEARGTEGKGGEIRLLGERVGLIGNTQVDASGDTGGGRILVGGDYQGKNTDVQNASRTYVGKGAQLFTDAIDRGDGGKIIIWSDNSTQFYGSASARGGTASGNGGFVETSGRQRLDFQGAVSTLAPSGKAGTLLIDPSDITITTSASSGSMSISQPFQDGTITTSNLDVTVLTGAGGLGGGNVLVDATTVGAGSGTGSITVSTPVSWANVNSLTLKASASITVDPLSAITNTGTGGLTFNADGAIVLNSPISLAGGAFTASGTAGGATGALSFTSGAAGTITTTAAADSGTTSGAVQITTTAGAINLAGDIVTKGANHATAAATASAGGQVDLTASGGTITVANITTSGGNATGGGASTGGAAAAINLTTTGGASNITLNAALTGLGGTGTNAGASGTVKLVSTGAVSDNTGAGSVKADGLRVSAVNASSLTNVANDVVTVAAGITGSGQGFTYKDANSVVIGTVATVNGITTSGGAVVVQAGGLLTVDQAILTTPTGAAGGSVILEATTSGIATSNLGTITTTGDGAFAGGQVYVHNVAGGNIVLGKAITATGGAGGSGGVVTVLNGAAAGTIEVNQVIDVSRGVGGAADGSILLKAGSDITEGASGGVKGDTDGKLLAYSVGGKVLLDTTATNQMATAAFKTDTAVGTNGTVTYKDNTALTLGTVANVGTLVVGAGVNASTVGPLSGITTIAGGTNGAVVIAAGTTTAHDIASTVAGVIKTTAGANTGTASGPVDLTSSGGITLAGNIVTTGAANTTGAGSTGGQVTLNAAGAIGLTGTIDTKGGSSTTLGATGGIVSVTSTGSTISVVGIDTSGSSAAVASGLAGGNAGSITLTTQTGKAITLNASQTADGGNANGVVAAAGKGGAITFANAGDVVLGTTITVESLDGTGAAVTGGGIKLTGKLDGTTPGAESLTLKDGTGSIDLQGIVGGGKALGTLTMSTGSTARFGANVTTAGTQDITAPTIKTNATHTTTNSKVELRGDVLVQGDTTFTTGSGNVTFYNKVDSDPAANKSLKINSTGITTFTDKVGDTKALSTLLTDAGGATRVEKGVVTTTGAQTYGDPVLAKLDTTFTGVNVQFNDRLNSETTGVNVTVNDSGSTKFGESVGTNIALTTLTTDAPGTTTIGSVTIRTTGAQTYKDPVILSGGGKSALDSTNNGAVAAGAAITFASAVSGTTAAADSLTITAGSSGSVTFSGNVGATRIGDVQVASANGVTASSGFSSKSLTTTTVNNQVQLFGAVDTTGPVSLNASGAVSASSITTKSGGAVTINNGGAITVSGNIAADGPVSLTASGPIGVSTITTTSGGPVTFNNGGTLTIGGNITADGAVTQTTTNAVALNGDITTTSDLVSFAGPVTLGGGARSIDTSSGGGGDITFGNTLNGGGNDLTLNAGTVGNVNFNGALSNLGALNLSKVNNLALLGGFSGTGLIQGSGTGSTTLGGVIVTNGPQGVAITTNGTITVTGQLSTNNNPVTFNASNWNFGGSTITAGTGQITISQVSNGTINIGSQLDTADLAALVTSNQLYVGGVSNTGIVNIDGSANFAATTPNVTLRATGAGGKLTQTNPTAIVGSPPTLLTLNADSGIGALGAPVRLTGANVATNNVSAGDIVLQFPSGNVNVQGQFTNTAPGGSVEVVASNGGITTATTLASDGSLSLTTNSNGAPAPMSIDSNGIVANGGLTLRAADALTIAGGAGLTARGNVTLIAGVAPGMSGANAVTTVRPASAPEAFRVGNMLVEGPVRATGDIIIESSGAVTQSTSSGAGIQSSSGPANGRLTVVTFNDAGAPISLKNNSTGGTGACAGASGSGNCAGTVQIEARFADGRVTEFAAADIDYQGISGISVQSIGTGTDARVMSRSVAMPTANIVARNASFYATGGNIDLNAQIANGNINRGASGGSLNLYAQGNVNVSAPTSPASAGVSIGRRASVDPRGTITADPFKHDLTLTATGDINITGSIYMAPDRDLNLRADASSGEVAPGLVPGAPALGDGAGSVRLTTQPASHYGSGADVFPLEVKARNIVVGTRQGSLVFPVQNLEISTTLPGPPADGSSQHADALLSAAENLEVYLTGDLRIAAGGTQAVTTATTQNLQSTAVAAMQGRDVFIRGVGTGDFGALRRNITSLFLTAGRAMADNGVGGDAFAAADAAIIATSTKTIDIGGDMWLQGGTTIRRRNADASLLNLVSAQAFLDPATMNIATGGSIVLIAGLGVNASARIRNSGDMKLSIGGQLPVTFFNPLTEKMETVAQGGLVLVGGPGSGIFDSFNNPTGLRAPPVEADFPGGGTYTLLDYPDRTLALAHIQSGPTRNFDSLLSYILYAANEETRVTRIRAGVSSKDDANLPSCN